MLLAWIMTVDIENMLAFLTSPCAEFLINLLILSITFCEYSLGMKFVWWTLYILLLIKPWGAGKSLREGSTLRKEVTKNSLTPLLTNTVMGQTAQLTALLTSLFLFQALKCLRSCKLCLLLKLSRALFCPSEVSKIKLISVLVIRKPGTEVQQRPLDGFLFNIFNKQSRNRVKEKNETKLFPLY